MAEKEPKCQLQVRVVTHQVELPVAVTVLGRTELEQEGFQVRVLRPRESLLEAVAVARTPPWRPRPVPGVWADRRADSGGRAWDRAGAWDGSVHSNHLRSGSASCDANDYSGKNSTACGSKGYPNTGSKSQRSETHTPTSLPHTPTPPPALPPPLGPPVQSFLRPFSRSGPARKRKRADALVAAAGRDGVRTGLQGGHGLQRGLRSRGQVRVEGSVGQSGMGGVGPGDRSRTWNSRDFGGSSR